MTTKIKDRFYERQEMFMIEHFNTLLNNHSLKGKYKNCRSINITGDYRAIYTINSDSCIFIRIGTHDELYGR
ncbi:MAG: type II toxin-antitoxin system mRNA interferase toxin, RelE/StbE family [Candidatus Vogelbacteria bacterium]|nr:type II toxin-antitoxin system mRNA interferase toxin, RelE/StbE family [Candidatus Vogelbacteria bacterium]